MVCVSNQARVCNVCVCAWDRSDECAPTHRFSRALLVHLEHINELVQTAPQVADRETILDSTRARQDRDISRHRNTTNKYAAIELLTFINPASTSPAASPGYPNPGLTLALPQ